jgi:hypothetical protein
VSDNSLFSKHMRLIGGDESTWSQEDRSENERLMKLRLPKLELKTSKLQEFKKQIQIGLSMLALASLVVVFVTQKKDETLRAKGSIQVSVIWERGGKVLKLTDDSILQDGDKIGATVISSEEAVAYWTITDSNMNVLSGAQDIESSKLVLEPGALKSFNSSYELTAPNQGEHLVVAVCPKPAADAKASPTAGDNKTGVFNREFVSRLLTEAQVRSNECLFVGYRLRKLP